MKLSNYRLNHEIGLNEIVDCTDLYNDNIETEKIPVSNFMHIFHYRKMFLPVSINKNTRYRKMRNIGKCAKDINIRHDALYTFRKISSMK